MSTVGGGVVVDVKGAAVAAAVETGDAVLLCDSAVDTPRPSRTHKLTNTLMANGRLVFISGPFRSSI